MGWFDTPEPLEGPATTTAADDAETLLTDEYGWSEEAADDAVSHSLTESLIHSGEGLQFAYEDAQTTPENLEGGPATVETDELAEDLLVSEYGWTEDAADDAVPNTFAESVENSAGGLSSAGSDAAEAINGLAEGGLFPWWAKYAAGGGLLVVLMIVARPYVSVAGGVVS